MDDYDVVQIYTAESPDPVDTVRVPTGRLRQELIEAIRREEDKAIIYGDGPRPVKVVFE